MRALIVYHGFEVVQISETSTSEVWTHSELAAAPMNECNADQLHNIRLKESNDKRLQLALHRRMKKLNNLWQFLSSQEHLPSPIASL